jgi:D-glycero-D-manno-heptose 1,7-bisphosphate phosphatase
MLEIQHFNSGVGPTHLILDRDSTLTIDSGYTFQLHDFAFLEGAVDALSLAKKMNMTVSIATNQSGVGRGLFTSKQLLAFNLHLKNQIYNQTGLQLSWILSCTHVEDDLCTCRKPNPGMLLRLMQLSNISNEKTAFFGNSDSDLLAGRNAGIYSKIAFGINLSEAIMEWGESLDSN